MKISETVFLKVESFTCINLMQHTSSVMQQTLGQFLPVFWWCSSELSRDSGRTGICKDSCFLR